MITELLKEGRENAVPAEDLMMILNITPRKLFEQIRAERRDGSLILSTKDNGGGYWLWDGSNFKELEQYYKMQRSGAVDVLATLKPVYKILKEHEREGNE